MSSSPFKDKTALVTNAASGMGRSIAERLAEAGAGRPTVNVAVVVVDDELSTG